jgi:hypothetical protein
LHSSFCILHSQQRNSGSCEFASIYAQIRSKAVSAKNKKVRSSRAPLACYSTGYAADCRGHPAVGIPLSPIGRRPLGPIRVNPRLFERFAQLFELSVSLRSAVAKPIPSSTAPRARLPDSPPQQHSLEHSA